MASIGERVLEALEHASLSLPHRGVAELIGMTPDAFSRALNDKRHFSSIEIARLADLLGADVHWLITGRADPNRLTVAARHDFDHATGRRSVPGRAGDQQALEDIALAYRQGYPEPQDGPRLPETAAAAREALGRDFVRLFADRLEQRLGIGVVRLSELSTAYSFWVGGRPVIAVPATGSWFRENWSIAHELGHLVLGHHDEGISERESDQHEAAANGFAADLLLPARAIQRTDWDSVSDERLAELIWAWGVSIEALSRRLSVLFGYVPGCVASWAGQATQRLLRRHVTGESDLDEITARMDAASQRRFPLSLQEAHLKRIESGDIGPDTLAWMLGIDPAALEVDSPRIPEVSTAELAAALGL